MSKYNNKKTVIDGIVFDSKKEAARYQDLKILERVGLIQGLEIQPIFALQESYIIGGRKVRALTYRADFAYFEGNQKVVEDVKGMRTAVYKIKKKLFEYKYGIEIRET